MTFKLQHPEDLISRLFILEYMREIGADALYKKSTKEQKKQLFYKYTSEDATTQVDVNWEYCIFNTTLVQLAAFMDSFLGEIETIEARRENFLKRQKAETFEEKLAAPVDVNIMDIAKASMNVTKNKIIGTDGFKL